MSIDEVGAGDVERNAVAPSQDGHRVGADLIGDIAVGGNPVAADHHRIDTPLLHQVADHVVGISVAGILSFFSSQAVIRAPWRNGRVSLT